MTISFIGSNLHLLCYCDITDKIEPGAETTLTSLIRNLGRVRYDYDAVYLSLFNFHIDY
jgi:hypothetical protein